jgi:hypothetical protein
MLRIVLVSGIVLACLLLSAQACMNPADNWAAGVVWNAGEETDFSTIEQIGEQGTDYYKSRDSDSVFYTYRSHYDPQNAMVYLGYFSMSYQADIVAPQMAIILDTTLDAQSFDFAKAVRTELDWLANTGFGIVKMSVPDRDLVQTALDSVDRGNAQYWTLQKAVLSYNQWYVYDTLTGEWDMHAVRGVYGCGLDVAFDLPPGELGPLSVKHGGVGLEPGMYGISVSPNPFGTSVDITADFKFKISNLKFKICNINGQQIFSKSVSSSERIRWNASGHPTGIYLLVVDTGTRKLSKRLVLKR